VRAGKGGVARTVPLNIEVRRDLWRWAVAQTTLANDEAPDARLRWTAAHAQTLMGWIQQEPMRPVIGSQKGGLRLTAPHVLERAASRRAEVQKS
jgi:hypothetical protein